MLLSHHHDRKEKFLQAYDVQGNPLGSAVHLIDLGIPESLITLNWEGLCWFTDSNGNNHLLLVNDTDKESKMHLCKIKAPENVRPN